MPALADAARKWLPPFVVDALHARFGQVRFRGDYESWAGALAECSGYDAAQILERVQAAALAVKRGEAAYERDGVLFEQIEHSWPLLASLLWIAAQRGGQLHVLDFGGALGSSYQQNRGFLGVLSSLRWSVVEQPHFVACGREHFETEQLKFYLDLAACRAASGQPDVLLLSSVLPYVEDPYALLAQLLAAGCRFVVVDRTPMLEGMRDRLTVQQVGRRMGAASYPAWFFARAKFLRAFEDKYRLLQEFASLDRANIPSRSRGFLFVRRGEDVR